MGEWADLSVYDGRRLLGRVFFLAEGAQPFLAGGQKLPRVVSRRAAIAAILAAAVVPEWPDEAGE